MARRQRDAALTAIFLVSLALPGAVKLSGVEHPILDEQRRLASPRELRAWWNEGFGLRDTLIRAANRARLALGITPSARVLLGDDGWLYYAGDSLADHQRAAVPFDDAELAAWGTLFQARRDWLAARGIRYLVVFAPDKQTIYPEHLHHDARGGRLDQLVGTLRARGTIEVLDLRPRLLEERRRWQVYYRTDSHWNDRGAAAAYDEILDRLARWYPALAARPDLRPRITQYCCRLGDLERMIGATTPTEDAVAALPKLSSADGTVVRLEGRDPTRPRAVFLHDSFLQPIVLELAQRFSEATFIRPPLIFDRDAILAERPDVVVHEVVERLLTRDLPVDPPERR